MLILAKSAGHQNRNSFFETKNQVPLTLETDNRLTMLQQLSNWRVMTVLKYFSSKNSTAIDTTQKYPTVQKLLARNSKS